MTDTQMTIRANGTRIAKGPLSTSSKRRFVFPLLLLGLAPLTACGELDDLLQAELPGQVVDGDLNDPQLAETLVAGAQADFECGFQGHLLGVEAGFANVFHYTDFQIEMIRIANPASSDHRARDRRVYEQPGSDLVHHASRPNASRGCDP